MANKYGIPNEVELLIRKRDTECVYCHKKMIYPCVGTDRRDWATIEHLNHIQDWDSVESYIKDGKPVSEIVAICCYRCNSSRREKPLREWFTGSYCMDPQRNINEKTVAKVVQDYISKYES